jgi:hypothetical protein
MSHARGCERRGQYRVARPIEQHCARMGLPELRTIIAADYRRMGSTDIHDRYSMHFLQPETSG